MSSLSLAAALTVAVLAIPSVDVAGQARNTTPPESFTANATFQGAGGAAATTLKINVQRYTPDAERDAVLQALKQGGYGNFVNALKKAPVVGTVTIGGQSFDIRWARAEDIKNGRSIVLVTDKPMFFIGAGRPDAKPREGFDVGVISFRIDNVGMGYDGRMAAAAKVKPGGPTGVEVSDYAEKLIDLKTITRDIK
jgi:hypothetical protein